MLCKRVGSPFEVCVDELPEPVAGDGDVVVAIDAVGLNFFDVLMVTGRYQLKPSLPFSPGAEFVGVVETVGRGVHGLAPGDRVAVVQRFGACREKIVVAAARAIPLPKEVPTLVGAGLFVAYGTALHALRDRGNLRAGETLAVLGAAGGVGHAAVDLGRALGARVIACVGSEAKAAFAADHGAHHTVNYATTNLRDRLKELTDGVGVDVLLDLVGGPHTEGALRAMRRRGRYLVAGFAAGEIPRVPLNLVLLKGVDLRGVILGGANRGEAAFPAGTVEKLIQLLAEGAIRPHVDKLYPLEETALGLSDIRERRAKGKIVVTTSRVGSFQ